MRMRKQVNINENEEEDYVVVEGGKVEDQRGSSGATSTLVPKQWIAIVCG